MNILVNGDKKKFEKELSLNELLEKLDLPQTRIAVEINKRVVRKKDWDATTINDADKIEIIHFVGGG